ncbi:uncharacterized protein LOC114256260 [Camellia sinensis]|uniref:uncharacterized protein LOC114256260 n=1 Tax=Camellia sinensis TaxID=4442 RepID=UPI001035A730|nr:uncharacterized protein LOC114256260 [Camellia sinensis]
MSITQNGYRSLSKTYEAATGLTHTIKQLKNRYNQLKAEWRAWSKLMDSRKGPTGIAFDQETGLINASGEWWARMQKAEWRAWSKLMDSRKGPTGIAFDQETGLINASDEWWARMQKVYKECCKFRTKWLDHEKLMRHVFTGVVATGKNAWMPGDVEPIEGGREVRQC